MSARSKENVSEPIVMREYLCFFVCKFVDFEDNPSESNSWTKPLSVYPDLARKNFTTTLDPYRSWQSRAINRLRV